MKSAAYGGEKSRFLMIMDFLESALMAPCPHFAVKFNDWQNRTVALSFFIIAEAFQNFNHFMAIQSDKKIRPERTDLYAKLPCMHVPPFLELKEGGTAFIAAASP